MEPSFFDELRCDAKHYYTIPPEGAILLILQQTRVRDTLVHIRKKTGNPLEVESVVEVPHTWVLSPTDVLLCLRIHVRSVSGKDLLQ